MENLTPIQSDSLWMFILKKEEYSDLWDAMINLKITVSDPLLILKGLCSNGDKSLKGVQYCLDKFLHANFPKKDEDTNPLLFNDSPLARASRNKCPLIVEHLIKLYKKEANVYLNFQKQIGEAFIIACSTCDETIIKIFLDAFPLIVNYQDIRFRSTALMNAVKRQNNSNVVKILLCAHHVDLNTYKNVRNYAIDENKEYIDEKIFEHVIESETRILKQEWNTKILCKYHEQQIICIYVMEKYCNILFQ